MLTEKFKIRVSSFVTAVLENDAQEFGFLRKSNESNISGLLNCLIPVLLELRKLRREQIHEILTEENQRTDAEKLYTCVNEVIDRVYFSDAELDRLDDEVWIYPRDKNTAAFDEIREEETRIAHTDFTVYIRGLLNEYVRLPQYRREVLVFNRELECFVDACSSGQIFHYKHFGKSCRAFAFHYKYGFVQDQNNYLIVYNISEKTVKAIPLHEIHDSYVVKQKFKPSEALIEVLNTYDENCRFDDEIRFTEEEI